MAKVELPAQRTRHSKRFVLDDGSFQEMFVTGAEHWWDETTNSWQDFDLTFQPNGSEWKVDKTHAKTQTGKKNGKSYLELIDRETDEGIRYLYAGNHSANGKFLNIGGGYRFILWRGGVKFEGPPVAQPKGQYLFEIEYELVGGSPLVEKSDFTVGNDTVTLKQPEAIDPNGKTYPLGLIDISTPGILRFLLDDTDVPDEFYPYRLDPTTSFNISTATNDGYMWCTGCSGTCSYTGQSWGSCANDPNMYIQKDTAASFGTGYTRWDTSTLPAGAVITSAATRLQWQVNQCSGRSAVADWSTPGSWPPTSADLPGNPPPGNAIAAGTIPNTSLPSYTTDVALSSASSNINKTGYTTLAWSVSGSTGSSSCYFWPDTYENSSNKPPQLYVTYSTPSYEQSTFRARNDDGSETTATWKKTAGTDWYQPVDTNFRIRFNIKATANAIQNQVFQLYSSKNGGTYQAVNGSSTNARSFASANVTDGAATTEQLAGAGTFRAGTFDEVDGQATGFTAAPSDTNDTEVEYCLQLRSADLVDGDQISFRIYVDGAAITTYTDTPVATVAQITTFSITSSSDDVIYGRWAASSGVISSGGGTGDGPYGSGSSDTLWVSRGFKSSNGSYQNYMGYLRWDTSSIPDGAIIQEASLKLWDEGSSSTSRNLFGYWSDWTTNGFSGSYAYNPTADAFPITAISNFDGLTPSTTALTNVSSNINKSGYTHLILSVDGSDSSTYNGISFDTIDWSGNEAQLVVTFTSAALNQTNFRGRNDDGNETTATWKAAAGSDWTQPLEENFRIRFNVQSGSDAATQNTSFGLYCSRNGGAFQAVNGSSTFVRSVTSPNVTDGAATTEQLAGTGTFRAGTFDEVDGVATGYTSADPSSGDDTEVEYCLYLRHADLTPGDTLNFRVYSGGSALGSYVDEPVVTVGPTTPERLIPDSQVSSSGYTSGAFGDVDEDPSGTLDGGKYTAADPSATSGSTDGPENPDAAAAVSGFTGQFTSPTQALDEDATPAVLDGWANGQTQWGNYFSFNAADWTSIPSNATIDAVDLVIRQDVSNNNRSDQFYQLGTANGTLIGSEYQFDTSNATTDDSVSYSNLGSPTVTRAQLVTGTFGVRLRGARTASQAVTWQVYWIRMTVTYSTPAVTTATAARFTLTSLSAGRQLDDGSGLQTVRIAVSKLGSGSNPTVTAKIYDGANLFATPINAQSVTSSTPALLTGTFDSTGFSTTNGSNMELSIESAGASGGLVEIQAADVLAAWEPEVVITTSAIWTPNQRLNYLRSLRWT